MMEQALAKQFASELAACLPQDAGRFAAVTGSAFGGLAGRVGDLIASLKAQEWQKVAVCVRDILNILIGDENTINFKDRAMQAQALNVDLAKLIAVILKLLPIVLGVS